MHIDLWTVALQGINFLVLVWLLQRFLYKPVRAVIAKRRELAQAAFVEAEKAKEAAEAARAALDSDRAKLAAERESVLNAAHKAMEVERATLLADAKQEAEKALADGRTALAADREAVLAALRREIAALAAELAGRLLAETGVAQDGDALLAAVVGRVGALAPEERAALVKELAGEGARLTAVMAAPLDEAAASRWRARLAEVLGFSGAIDFETDPALIGGAELRFPHAVLRLSWADWLAQAREALAAQ